MKEQLNLHGDAHIGELAAKTDDTPPPRLPMAFHLSIGAKKRESALHNIHAAYPIQTHKLLTLESCAPLLDLVEQGVVMIEDPNVRGEKRIGMLKGEKWSPDRSDEVMKAANLVHALTEPWRRAQFSRAQVASNEKQIAASAKRRRRAEKHRKLVERDNAKET